jgi:glycosyltransferase involved in cell wall biosynthesis
MSGISAIVAVYNGRRHLRETLLSVFAQTLQPQELLIVDDGSTDDSLSVLDSLPQAPFPVRVFRQENSGQSAARNLAAREARGELLAVLDQDDLWYPTHLEQLVVPFARAEVGWVYSDFDEMDLDGHVVTRSFLRAHGVVHPKRTIFSCVERDLMVLPSASMLRREAYQQAGGFDEALSGYEDDDLFIRFFRLGWEHVFIEAPQVRFRIHASGSSASSRFLESRMRFAAKLEVMFPDDPRMRRYYMADAIAPRLFATTLDDYVRACSARDWALAERTLIALNHFAFRRRSGARLRWKLSWIQHPKVFRMLVAMNDRLPYRARFIRNPTVTLR